MEPAPDVTRIRHECTQRQHALVRRLRGIRDEDLLLGEDFLDASAQDRTRQLEAQQAMAEALGQIDDWLGRQAAEAVVVDNLDQAIKARRKKLRADQMGDYGTKDAWYREKHREAIDEVERLRRERDRLGSDSDEFERSVLERQLENAEFRANTFDNTLLPAVAGTADVIELTHGLEDLNDLLQRQPLEAARQARRQLDRRRRLRKRVRVGSRLVFGLAIFVLGVNALLQPLERWVALAMLAATLAWVVEQFLVEPALARWLARERRRALLAELPASCSAYLAELEIQARLRKELQAPRG
jgi:hypothetical protein